jgi:hypothetical protein
MTTQDWFDNPIPGPKVPSDAGGPIRTHKSKEPTKRIPEWARSAGNEYGKWFKGHKDKDMCEKMLKMMTKPHGTELKATLDREINLIKAIQQFNGIQQMEKKIGWNEADFTVWLFLEFKGKVKKYRNKRFNVLMLGPLEFVRTRALFMSGPLFL